jgi:ElaB/YqjD/DUF883 family membrane-anchored ribosome-binding protein
MKKIKLTHKEELKELRDTLQKERKESESKITDLINQANDLSSRPVQAKIVIARIDIVLGLLIIGFFLSSLL